MAVNRKVTPYPLDSAFERSLITLLCQRPKLFARIGRALDPESLNNEHSKILLRAVQSLGQEFGIGPDSTITVVQRLRKFWDDGRLREEQIFECLDYLDAAEDAGLPDEEHVAQGIIPILRERAQRRVMLEINDGLGKRKDIRPAVEELQRATHLGDTFDSSGIKLGNGSFEAIRRIRGLERLPIDVPEIDTLLEGGLWRKALGIVIAPSGWGKSIYLSHQTTSAIRAGRFVALATLELPEPIIIARIKANLLGYTIDEILNGSLEKAEKKFASIAPSLGLCAVKEFSPKATTIQDIFSWVKDLEAEEGKKVDLLVVDYADKVGTGRAEDNSYVTGGTVFEGLRHYAVERDIWCWTASQPRRMTKGQKRIELDDIADSMNKARVADLVVTMSPKDDGDQLSYYLAKNRMGKTGRSVDDLPQEFEYGRIAPTTRDTDFGMASNELYDY